MRFPEDTAEITPITDLFVYHIFGEPSALRQWQTPPETYALEVRGLIGRPRAYSFKQIRESFAMVSTVVVLQCMTRVHWGRIRVKGVRLLDILEAVEPDPAAFKLALFGCEGYTTDPQRPERVAEDADPGPPRPLSADARPARQSHAPESH